MLTKERPHLTRCVDAGASGPDDPSRHRLAAGPMTSFFLVFIAIREHAAV